MSQIKELLGMRIREIRQARKLTQEQLSELTGIGAPSLSKIESGIFHPTDENLEKISQALNIETYKLYMYDHFRDVQELKSEIINMINGASDNEIRLAHRILNSFFN